MSLPDADAVARFLRENPDFLARNPELYRHLTPPDRRHGEPLADHMESMLTHARRDAAAARSKADTLLDAERTGVELTARVQVCVLALFGEEEIGAWVEESLPGLLGIDAAALRSEDDALPPGSIAALLGTSATITDTSAAPTHQHRALHGAAAGLAQHGAYVRVPLERGGLVLALACRDRPVAQGAAALEALAFLGAAIGACLDRPRRPRPRLAAIT